MDVITHTLLGGALAYAATPTRTPLGVRDRVLLGGVAAAFPDIDFIAFPLNPLVFLSDWHQAPTHSLLLLPLWSFVIVGLFSVVSRRRGAFAPAFLVATLGLVSHIAADVVTAYGTAILYPLSDSRFSLSTTFVIDTLFTTVIAVGLTFSLWRRRRDATVIALAFLCVYVGGLGLLKQQAIEAGWASARENHIQPDSLHALPQPFSPFNWKLIGVQGPIRYTAHVNLVSHSPLVPSLPGLRRVAAIAKAYQAPTQLTWQYRHRYGDRPALRPLVAQLWQHPRFAAFRRFSVHPALSRIDDDGDGACVWFTDLRYDLPALPDTFRFGFCRDRSGNPWQLYRLRYFSKHDRQALPE